MADRRPTIHDVAQAAGVSAMSVSRVLNSRPGVSPETARRIEQAVRTLGYRPNMLAANFRQQRGVSLIGMIVPDPYTPLFTSVAVAVGELVRDHGLIVVTASSGGDVAQERALVTSFFERGIDGILLFSEDHDHRYLEPELDRGRPLVFLGSPPVGVMGPTVLVDNRGGAAEAVAHLLRHGHRRIGIVTKPASFPASERLAGYREAVARHGIDTDPSLVHVVANVAEPGRRAVEALLARPDPPTAIFSTNYLLTAGMLGPFRAYPPVALVAFDDFEAALLVDPPISVVTQDPPAMAAHATRMLLAQLDGIGDRAAVAVVPPRLIPRGTGELPPAKGVRYRYRRFGATVKRSASR
ncbi:MAG TPA: LacI family DNA-binding transcriptional regulator [Candidatus Limnocylindrales bacterium]|nr:LacI family DNA-binding transcriptional regulator [Candidatus Limnocylindrales bacterium]